MITNCGFTDTAEDIHPPTDEENAAYRAEVLEVEEDAAAMLATVRHLLTGHEIDTLETVVDGNGEVDYAAFQSLRIQFYAQITNHKDGRASA